MLIKGSPDDVTDIFYDYSTDNRETLGLPEIYLN